MIFKSAKSATKALIQTTLIFLLSAMSFSCSEFLKGKPKKNDVIEVKKDSFSCLKKVSLEVQSFLKSESSDSQIEETFSCIDQTLNEFQNRVEGKSDANSYTAEELFQIFDKFLNDAQISKNATNDILVLKSAVFGGSTEKITKTEISSLREYLILLKAEVKALLPYAKLFRFKKEETSFSKKMIQDGFAQLNLSLKNLLKSSQVARSEYQFDDLKRLILNLRLLDQDQAVLLDLATKVKDLLLGYEIIRSEQDYNLFIDNFTEVLRLHSVQLNGYVHFEISTSQGMDNILEYVQGWVDLLENSIQYKKTQMILVETLDPLIIEISKKGILPVEVSANTLVSFYKTLIVRGFESGVTGDVNSFAGLKRINFVNIKRELAVFKMYFQFINSVAGAEVLKSAGKERISISQLQQQMKSFDPVTASTSQSSILKNFDDSNQKQIIKAFEELKSEFLSTRPVVYRFKKMVIAVNQEIWDQNWEDLARAAYGKMLARELLIGWGNVNSSKEVLNAYLLEDNLVQWYAEFKQFGIEAKIFDPRSLNAGAVSFKQANLLTYSADGDDKMNFMESVQYLNLLASGGGQTLAELRAGFTKANCNLNEKDAFGFTWNDEKCVVADLKKNFQFYFSNLSYLTGYLSKLNDQQFTDFYFSVMEITRVDPQMKTLNKVDTADLRAMSILLHFIESLYATFDINRNWTVSAPEIRAAYPRFKIFAKDYAYKNAKDSIDEFNSFYGTIGGYSCYSEEDLIREGFVFLVYHGRTPGKSDLNTAPCLFRNSLIDFSGEVDRKTIINTFKILKAVLGS